MIFHALSQCITCIYHGGLFLKEMKGVTPNRNQHIAQVVKLIIYLLHGSRIAAQLRQVLFLGLHYNLMPSFTTQALQDPSSCSSTIRSLAGSRPHIDEFEVPQLRELIKLQGWAGGCSAGHIHIYIHIQIIQGGGHYTVKNIFESRKLVLDMLTSRLLFTLTGLFIQSLLVQYIFFLF